MSMMQGRGLVAEVFGWGGTMCVHHARWGPGGWA